MRKLSVAGLAFIPFILFAHGGKVHIKKEVPVVVKPTQAELIEKAYASINESYLKEVKPIFQAKCFDCHSNQVKQRWYSNLPGVKQLIAYDVEEAKSHIDFSNDFPFVSHDTPINDLKELLEISETKSMPPLRYRVLHSGTTLTEEDSKIIQQWSNKSLEKINAITE